MASPDVYRRYAAECLALARRAADADDKARLLQMAQTWLALAEKLESKHQ
jgi:hypothetical protein